MPNDPVYNTAKKFFFTLLAKIMKKNAMPVCVPPPDISIPAHPCFPASDAIFPKSMVFIVAFRIILS
jgi:hypothetical protein